MDELLIEFLAETGEHLDAVGGDLVRFEQNPNDPDLIARIFRIVHSIKGTCGFFGLSRLSSLAHAAEDLLGCLRDGAHATGATVSVVFDALDRLKAIVAGTQADGSEPEGDDAGLIATLERTAAELGTGRTARRAAAVPDHPEPQPPSRDRRSVPANPPARFSERKAEMVRVSVGAIEELMALVSELVLTRNQLLELVRRRTDEPMKGPVQRLASLTSELQHGVMKARMQPVARLFASLPRLVRELSLELGKPVSLTATGEETELDRQLIELIRDPLTHMVRNAVDHGIEPPEERRALGKPPTGLVRIVSSQSAGQFVIEVSDDGRGIDPAIVRQRALELGLASEAELRGMSPDAIRRFVLAPGFSTAAQVTTVSGRGVGLDVVRRNIEAIGGSVALGSPPGGGTTVTLRIPLTLAIAPALVVSVRGARYALPQHAVLEVIGLAEDAEPRIEFVQGAMVLRVRTVLLPVADLGDVLDGPEAGRQPAPERSVVVLGVEAARFGVVVDAVDDLQEIVVKPLPRVLAGLGLYSGNTILGDGSVALILDPAGLATAIGIPAAQLEQAPPTPTDADPQRISTDGRIILFRAGEGAPKALPLSVVKRIDRLDPASIDIVDGLRVTRHEGRLLPLVPVDTSGRAVPAGPVPVLIVEADDLFVGLLVSEIIDVVEGQLDVALPGSGDGVVAVADLHGQAVEILDPASFLARGRTRSRPPGERIRPRLLLVDNRTVFRDLLLPLLAAEGYLATTAVTGSEALEQVDGGSFDAVLVDLQLPDGGAYELTRRLRADMRHAGLPIFGLATHRAEPLDGLARAAGMSAVIGKYDRAGLLEALDSGARRPDRTGAAA